MCHIPFTRSLVSTRAYPSCHTNSCPSTPTTPLNPYPSFNPLTQDAPVGFFGGYVSGDLYNSCGGDTDATDVYSTAPFIDSFVAFNASRDYRWEGAHGGALALSKDTAAWIDAKEGAVGSKGPS